MLVSQITATQSSVSNNPLVLTSVPIIAQASSKGSKFQSITSQKDELPPRKPRPEKAISMLSKPSISLNRPKCKRQQSWIFEQSSMKRQNSAEDTNNIANTPLTQIRDGFVKESKLGYLGELAVLGLGLGQNELPSQ